MLTLLAAASAWCAAPSPQPLASPVLAGRRAIVSGYANAELESKRVAFLPTFDRRRMLAAVPVAALLPVNAAPQQLVFTTSESGLRFADIRVGSGDAVEPSSRVTFHAKGRLVGKQGWVYLDTQDEDDEPFRLTMGQDAMIPGLAEGLLGMRIGGTRRLVVPSGLGYSSRAEEPRPRSFGQQQRLYGTVLNQNRRTQEAQGLGEGQDVAGMVALDIQLINVRPPLP